MKEREETEFDDLEPLSKSSKRPSPASLPELPEEHLELTDLPGTSTPAAKPTPPPVAPRQSAPPQKPSPPQARPSAPQARPSPPPARSSPPPPAPKAPAPEPVGPSAGAPEPVRSPGAAVPAADPAQPAASELGKPLLIEEEPQPAAPAVASAGAGSTPGGDSEGEGRSRGRTAAQAPQGKRELDRAPLELRKASVVLLAGSIFPWGDPSNLALGPLLEKLLCYLAVWIFYQSHVLKHEGRANGLVTSLGKSNLKVPMILAGVIALVGLAPVVSAGNATGLQMFTSLTEKAFLLLAGYTFVHIYDYEHGGKFNPMFPLLFLAPAVGGFASIFTKILPQFGERAGAAVVSLLGAVLVALGGLIACHTMYVAMKEAKAHGEAKKQAALEARRAARESRQGPGGPARGPRSSARAGKKDEKKDGGGE